MSKKPKKPKPRSTQPIRVIYQQSPQFRVIHVDGATGSLAVTGRYVMIGVYSERKPVPDTEMYVIGDAKLVKTSPPETIPTITREVEASLMVDIPTAQALYDWIGERLREHGVAMEAALKAQKEGGHGRSA